MREIDRWDFEPFARDVLPHVELGPVAEREYPHVLALVNAGIVEAPKFGPLVFRIPLTEGVAEGKDPFLGTRFLLVAPCAPDQRIEAEFLDRVAQRHRLMPVAALVGMSQDDPAVDDRVFDRPHNQTLAKLRDAPVAKIDDFRKVVAGIDM